MSPCLPVSLPSLYPSPPDRLHQPSRSGDAYRLSLHIHVFLPVPLSLSLSVRPSRLPARYFSLSFPVSFSFSVSLYLSPHLFSPSLALSSSLSLNTSLPDRLRRPSLSGDAHNLFLHPCLPPGPALFVSLSSSVPSSTPLLVSLPLHPCALFHSVLSAPPIPALRAPFPLSVPALLEMCEDANKSRQDKHGFGARMTRMSRRILFVANPAWSDWPGSTPRNKFAEPRVQRREDTSLFDFGSHAASDSPSFLLRIFDPLEDLTPPPLPSEPLWTSSRAYRGPSWALLATLGSGLDHFRSKVAIQLRLWTPSCLMKISKAPLASFAKPSTCPEHCNAQRFSKVCSLPSSQHITLNLAPQNHQIKPNSPPRHHTVGPRSPKKAQDGPKMTLKTCGNH